VIVGVNAFAADTDADAQRLFTSLQQRFLQMIRGRRELLPPPVETMDGIWSPQEQAMVNQKLQYSAVGSPATVRSFFEKIIQSTSADELIMSGDIYDQPARLHSYEIAASVMREINS